MGLLKGLFWIGLFCRENCYINGSDDKNVMGVGSRNEADC